VLACTSISDEVSITFVDLVVLFIDGPPGIVGEAFHEDGIFEPKLMLRILPAPGCFDILFYFCFVLKVADALRRL
jgi:hypothetical protein